jgi:hypothetical protein
MTRNEIDAYINARLDDIWKIQQSSKIEDGQKRAMVNFLVGKIKQAEKLTPDCQSETMGNIVDALMDSVKITVEEDNE